MNSGLLVFYRMFNKDVRLAVSKQTDEKGSNIMHFIGSFFCIVCMAVAHSQSVLCASAHSPNKIAVANPLCTVASFFFFFFDKSLTYGFFCLVVVASVGSMVLSSGVGRHQGPLPNTDRVAVIDFRRV